MFGMESSGKYNCVLLVDDDGVTNFINNRLLKKLNLTDCIQTAINGKEGLKYLAEYAKSNENTCPELIFLDLNMPVIDGFEFLDEFNKLTFANKEKVKVIILTTSTHQKDINQIVSQKSIGYINKPLTEEKVLQALGMKVND